MSRTWIVMPLMFATLTAQAGEWVGRYSIVNMPGARLSTLVNQVTA